jgi:hypothetical protein
LILEPRRVTLGRSTVTQVTPSSSIPDIDWPGLPKSSDAVVFAILFQLEQSQWWSPEELWMHQRRQLSKLIAHAARTVPFYKKRLRPDAKLKPEGVP